MTHELIALPYPYVSDYLSKKRTLFIPFGTIEAHGRHLPIGTDTLIARAIATTLAERCDALVAPPLEYGITNSLFRYPVASFIPQDVYENFVWAIMTSFAAHGFSRLVLINGHGGHISALNNLVTRFGKQTGQRAAVLHWWLTASSIAEEHFGGAAGHAAADETSFILTIDESLVHTELYDPESHFTIPDGMTVQPAPGTVLYYKSEGPPPNFDSVKALHYREAVITYLYTVFEKIFAGWDELDRVERS